jgi:cytoskeleton protein RodZ
MLAVGGLVILASIVAWNVFRRATPEKPVSAPREAVAEAPATPAPVRPAGGAVSLGAPLPAPVESTTPTPYETPGLAAATAAGGSADAAIAAQTAAANQPKPAETTDVASTKVFTPKGQIYGAPAGSGSVVLQATRSASLVVRGADESVYFARQLSEGEAFRAPAVAGLVIDVSDPAAFDVYAGGAHKGALPAALTPLSKLTPAKPAAPAKPAPAPATAQPSAAAPTPPAPAATARP